MNYYVRSEKEIIINNSFGGSKKDIIVFYDLSMNKARAIRLIKVLKFIGRKNIKLIQEE